jgi:transcriptional regulator with XRE-family HTH domain
MNERELKMGLRQLVNEGWSVRNIDDEFLDSLLRRESDPPSDEVREHFMLKLLPRIQDASIKKARLAWKPGVVPFGVFIASIRESAKLTRAEIGARLGKEESFIQRIEQGDVDPSHLPLPDFADLAILFQIKIKEAIKLVDASRQNTEWNKNSDKSAPLSGGSWEDPENEESAKALELNSGKLMGNIAGSQLYVNDEAEDFWTSLRNELDRRGRRDLLN